MLRVRLALGERWRARRYQRAHGLKSHRPEVAAAMAERRERALREQIARIAWGEE